MVSKNNRQILKQSGAKQTPHYGLRKLSIGVASVLLSTTFYMGATTVYADSNSESTLQAECTTQQSATGVNKESLPVGSGSNNQQTNEEKSAGAAKPNDYDSSAQANEPNRPTEKAAQNVTTLSGPFQYTVHYVDDDDNGSVIKTATLNGATDQTVKTNISIPPTTSLRGNIPSRLVLMLTLQFI